MRSSKHSLALFLAAACAVSTSSLAQIASEKPATLPAASAPTAVPSLVPCSGVALDADGKPLTGETTVTFLIFKDEQGGEPLFAETQSIIPNSAGQYKVQLGATLANGLPADLFATGEARWIEAQIADQPPQTRTLLTSVPYALKAANATTFNGLPLSAFVLAGSKAAVQTDALQTPANAAATSATVTTTGGTSGTVPLFTGAATIANSKIFQSASGIGINTGTPAAALDVNGATDLRGAVELTPAGTATSSSGVNSNQLNLTAQAYNSTTKTTVSPSFGWRAAAVGNDTASPAASLQLLYSNGSIPATTGFSFNANGTINFASGQTFPGTGNGTITGVTAGTGLIGGGTSGNVTVAVDPTKVVSSVAASVGLTGGGKGGNLALAVDPTQVPLLNSANTFNQTLTVAGQIVAGLNVGTAGGVLLPASQNGVGYFYGSGFISNPLGFTSYPLDLQSTTRTSSSSVIPQDFRLQAEPAYLPSGQPGGSLNLLYGANGGAPSETGFSIYADGQIGASGSLLSQPSGQIITAPVATIQADDNGAIRSTAQQLSIQGATNPLQQLLIGYVSNNETNSSGGYGTVQATWNGRYNTPLLLNPNGGGVGIQTANVTNVLTIGQGQGQAVADGWATYSSRRFKTDIQTLPNALEKVEKLRGVSYTFKATGKREIGVIAEEVGKVVPEVVTYEKNGVDAQSVDYTRLTALLIEATKQQQAEIASALKQIKTQRQQLHQQTANIANLKSQVRQSNESLRKVRQQLAGSLSEPLEVAANAAR